MSAREILNKVCRNTNIYEKARFIVPNNRVDWSIAFPTYEPPTYTVECLSKNSWADPEIGAEDFKPKWNSCDLANGVKIDRQSYIGKIIRTYRVKEGFPLNPMGRTGLRGRGKLGRWGPNHAADAIVTRWKRDEYGNVIKDSVFNAPILQFVSILRKDCNEWAIPGGFVEPNEKICDAVQREFQEEALNDDELTDREKARLRSRLTMFFARGVQVYRGYVDDPRNTDNAWIETLAMNFHDESGDLFNALNLKSGDDAADVKWIDFDRHLELYASHVEIVEKVALRHEVLL